MDWIQPGVLTWLSILAVISVVILPLLILRTDKSSAIGAAFVATGPLVPMVASVAIVLCYLFLPKWTTKDDWPLGDFPVSVGSIFALILWLVSAWVYKGFTSADRANASSYGELYQRLSKLNAKLLVACPTDASSMSIPCREAWYHSRDIARKLGVDMTGEPYMEKDEEQDDYENQGHKAKKHQKQHKPNDSLNWVMATGYIDLWGRMYRAEEAMFEVEEIPQTAVIRWAIHDDLRLAGSTIEKKDDLRGKLREAVSVLDPNALKYLSPPGGQTARSVSGGSSPPAGENEIKQARAVLHEVCHNVNDFRAKRWGGLVRARNHLLASISFTGLTMYIVLAIVLMNDTKREAVLAASIFFLTGALVGLFKRLRDEASGGAIQDDDYGLSRTRLIHTPLFSGLAAVGGVVLSAMAPALLTNLVSLPQGGAGIPSATQILSATQTARIVAATPSTPLAEATTSSVVITQTPLPILTITPIPTITPTATAAATNTVVADSTSIIVAPPAQMLPQLEDIFNLEVNRFGLIIAAIFGLAPVLLIDTLQKEVDGYRKDLKSTEAPQSSED